jgi:hypothetical protein
VSRYVLDPGERPGWHPVFRFGGPAPARRGLGAMRLRVVLWATQEGEQPQVVWLVGELVDVGVVPGVEGLKRLVEVQGPRRCERGRWHQGGRQRAGGGRARVGSCSRTGGGELREGWVLAHGLGRGARARGVGYCSRLVCACGVGLCSRWWHAGSVSGRAVAPVHRTRRPLIPSHARLVYVAIDAAGVASRPPWRGGGGLLTQGTTGGGWGLAHDAVTPVGVGLCSWSCVAKLARSHSGGLLTQGWGCAHAVVGDGLGLSAGACTFAANDRACGASARVVASRGGRRAGGLDG